MENISVHVRVRPLAACERESGWKTDGKCKISPAAGGDDIIMDNVFDPSWTTAQVYEKTTAEVIEKVVGGFNGTVFAYGQTSSGKTHTMMGCPEEPGIVPLAVAAIFDRIERMQDREFLLRVSYMEMYNEEVNDLLAPEHKRLAVHESREAGVYVAGLREDIVTCPATVMQLLAQGERARHFGETKMNANSSRSHTLFRMVVESRARDAETDEGGAVWVSCLTLVDLAGSERLGKTGAEGIRAKEGTMINKSLLTLGTVISKLAEGVQLAGGHIPYRDSKLTRILQPSLGGNAKTSIICAITPASQHADETHSTLRFAQRAKQVVNNAVVNEVLSDAAVLKRQAREIELLRRKLGDNSNSEVEEQIAGMRAQLLHAEQGRQLLEEQLAEAQAERERDQRRVEGLTRLVMGEADARGEGNEENAGSPKQRRGNRRDTWAPGVLGGGGRRKKRPLQATQLNELDLESMTPLGGSFISAKSGCEPGGSDTQGMQPTSPPHQRRRSTGAVGTAPGASAAAGASSNAEEVVALQAALKEALLETSLLQKENQSLQEVASCYETQLHDAEAELESSGKRADVAQEAASDSINALRKAEWQARETERRADEASANLAAAEQAVATMQEQLKALQGESLERASAAESHATAVMASASAAAQELSAAQAAAKAALESASAGEARAMAAETKLQQLGEKLTATETSLTEHKDNAAAGREDVSRLGEQLAALESSHAEAVISNQRLEQHVQDLESRKRAPLYNKKQEEETKAALESAVQAKAVAAEARVAVKEAEAAKLAAESKTNEAEAALQGALRDAESAAAAVEASHCASLARLAAEQDETRSAHSAALKEVHAQLAEAQSAAQSSAREVATLSGDCEQAAALIDTLEQQTHSLKEQLEENVERISGQTSRIEQLEADADTASAEAKAAADSAAARLEEARVAAAAAAEEAAAELAAAVADREARIVALQEAKAQAEAAGIAAVEAERATAADAAKASSAEVEAAKKALAESESQRDSLALKVAQAAGAIHAAEELKECRRKHKMEVVSLQQAAKASAVGAKGGATTAERLKKELEKTREKLSTVETKLRGVLSDKAAAQSEKAAAERQLKALQGQTGRMAKDLEKQGAVENKKRETMMVGLKASKTEIGTLQDSLARVQLELERVQFSLEAKTGECAGIASDLEISQAALEEASSSRDTASGQLQDLRAEHAELEASHALTREELTSQSTALTQSQVAHSEAETVLAEQRSIVSDLRSSIATLEADLEREKTELAAMTAQCKDAEARLPRISELEAELKVTQEEAGDADFRATELAVNQSTQLAALMGQKAALETAAAAAATNAKNEQTELLQRIEGVEKQFAEATTKLEAAESALKEGTLAKTAVDQELQEHLEYAETIEGQLTSAQQEVSRLTEAAESATAQVLIVEGKAAEAQTTAALALAEAATIHERLTSEAHAIRDQLSQLQSAKQSTDEEVTFLQEQVQAAQSASTAATVATEATVQKLQAELEAVQQAAARWEAAAQSSAEANAALKLAGEIAAKNLTALEERLEVKTSEAVSSAQLAEKQATQLVELDARCTKASAKAEALQGDLHRLQVAAAEGESASEAARQQLASHEATEAELRTRLAAAQERAEESAAGLVALQAAAEAAKKEAADKQAALEQLQTETQLLEELKVAVEQEAMQLAADLEQAVSKAENTEVAAAEAAQEAQLQLDESKRNFDAILAEARAETVSAVKAVQVDAARTAAADATAAAVRHDDLVRLVDEARSAARAAEEESSAALDSRSKALAVTEALRAQLTQLQAALQESKNEAHAGERECMQLSKCHAKEISDLQAGLQQAAEHDREIVTAAAETRVAAARKLEQDALGRASKAVAEADRLKAQMAAMAAAAAAGDPAAASAAQQQVTEVKEQAERRIAKLHAALQTADSRNRQLAADAVNAAPPASLTDQKVVASLEARAASAEGSLRKALRSSTRVQGIFMRMRSDCKDLFGFDFQDFDALKAKREAQYDMLYAKSKAQRLSKTGAETPSVALNHVMEDQENSATGQLHGTALQAAATATTYGWKDGCVPQPFETAPVTLTPLAPKRRQRT